jgi:hypothetical protein
MLGRTSPGANTLLTIGVLSLYSQLAEIALIVFHAQDEHRQSALLVEIFFRDCHRQNPVKTMLAVCGFVAMLAGLLGATTAPV